MPSLTAVDRVLVLMLIVMLVGAGTAFVLRPGMVGILVLAGVACAAVAIYYRIRDSLRGRSAGPHRQMALTGVPTGIATAVIILLVVTLTR